MALLRTGDRSVSEVCLDVGFTSFATFSRTFREIVGESPSAYRRRAPTLPDVPTCFAKAWTRPSSFGISGSPTTCLASSPCTQPSRSHRSSSSSRTKPSHFYVNTLRLEVHTDADLGFMRWLTVNVPGDRSRQILLERPGPPAMDDKTAEQVGDLVSKGGGGWLALATDDAHATYETLVARGVDITDEPTRKSYGIDFGIRDPFGNRNRIGQLDPA